MPSKVVSQRAWYLVIGLAFAVHNAEEGMAAERLREFMQFDAPMAFRTFYAGITAGELRWSLAILTGVGLVVTALAVRRPLSRRAAYVMLVFAAVIGLNALAHLAFSGVARTFMPGLVTAVLITLPVAIVVCLRARRDRWVSTTAYWTAFPMALVIHGPVLALSVRATIDTLRLLTGRAT